MPTVHAENGELVFLHEAGPGAADRSYGVQVARLAGVRFFHLLREIRSELLLAYSSAASATPIADASVRTPSPANISTPNRSSGSLVVK